MEIEKLTDAQYWEDSYKEVEFRKINETSEEYVWLENNLPKAKENGTSFEIGIYPASFSAIFGDLGYIINGIDRVKNTKKGMKAWLEKENYKTGDLICDDLFSYNFKRKYDVVASFGFIEHFKNFEEVIKIQANLVADHGHIVIGVPNFRGKVQFFLKKMLDKKNLDIHYTPSMNFKKWEKVLKDNNFEIVNKDYLGKFSFMTYPQKRNFFQREILRFMKRRKYFIKKHLFKSVSKHYSPSMIMVAKKMK